MKMDYDSSSKFISSLAKFLQSLCNGYVEFDNGVQVIGHLYVSVDTGKTIDYILNEKVCKTDENSVTFISNSFHAQPAEKPKPPGKKLRDIDRIDPKPDNDGTEINSGNQGEPRSTNFGTVPPRGSQNSPHSQGTKRPFSPSLKQSRGDASPSKFGRASPRHKKNRPEPADPNLPSQTSNPASENSISSEPSPAAQNSDLPYIDSYQPSFFDPGDEENSVTEETEERDIKPNIDTDVTFIKEEFTSSSCSQSGSQNRDRGHDDDPNSYGGYSNQVFPGGGFGGQAGFGASVSSSQRSNFNPAGDRTSNIYNTGPGSSQMEGGESSGDPSGPLNLGIERKQYGASANQQRSDLLNSNSVVNSGTSNILAWAQRRMSYPPNSMLDTVRGTNSFSYQENLGPPRGLSQSSSSGYRRMSRDVYGNPMFSSCSKCGGKYTNPAMCISHETNCNGTNRLMCQICMRVYSQMCALKEHLRGKHGLGEPLVCKLCGRSFKYKPQLYDHSCTGMNPKDRHSQRSPGQGPRVISLTGRPSDSLNQQSSSQVKEEAVNSQSQCSLMKATDPQTLHSMMLPTDEAEEDQ